MNCWYFRSDQDDPCFVQMDLLGVTFGPLEVPGLAEDEHPAWRATWNQGTWSWHWGFASLEKMTLCIGLAEKLQTLPNTATLDEFCAALEAVGFRNHRDWLNSVEYQSSRGYQELKARLRGS